MLYSTSYQHNYNYVSAVIIIISDTFLFCKNNKVHIHYLQISKVHKKVYTKLIDKTVTAHKSTVYNKTTGIQWLISSPYCDE